MTHNIVRLFTIALGLLALQPAHADQWLPGFGAEPEGSLTHVTPYRTGFVGIGPALPTLDGNGQTTYPIFRIWEDGVWSTTGDLGLNGAFATSTLNTVGVYRDDLCVGGSFASLGPAAPWPFLACWSVSRKLWYQPGGDGNGPNGPVSSIVFDGSIFLYVGGTFTQITDLSQAVIDVRNIVRTDGSEWEPLFNLGMIDNGVPTPVSQISQVNGFTFATAGRSLHRWNPTGPTWTLMGSTNGVGFPSDMQFFDNEVVIGGGNFTEVSGEDAVNVAGIAPTGTDWQALGDPMMGSPSVFNLAATSSFLYADGDWTSLLPASQGLARWTSFAWEAVDTTALGSALSPFIDIFTPTDRLCLLHGGLIQADINSAGVVCQNTLVGEWYGLSQGLDLGAGSSASAVAMYAGELYVGGGFLAAGDANAVGVARWNGSRWQTVGDGLGNTSGNPSVSHLEVYDNELYAIGVFDLADGQAATNIARWNGTRWDPIPGGISGPVATAKVYAGELYVGGFFMTTSGCTNANLCRWNGTSWSDVAGDANAAVDALDVYEGELLALGSFSDVGGVSTSNMASWDGSQWRSPGELFLPIGGEVLTTLVSGSDLYIGGSFGRINPGNIDANSIARWDGTQWSSLGSGVAGGLLGRVHALAGTGDQLYAAGDFDTVDGMSANAIGKWDGQAWSALGRGLTSTSTIAINPRAGVGQGLLLENQVMYVVGGFDRSGDEWASGIAVLDIDGIFSSTFDSLF